MTTKELYLKTLFSCIACDGDIAKEEVDMVRQMSMENEVFAGMDTESMLNGWITEINEGGASFLATYLDELGKTQLSQEEQLTLVDIAIGAIEADNRIDYSEVKFFKKIRLRLSVGDDEILARHPDKEDFLLPDAKVMEVPDWKDNIQFSRLDFDNDKGK